MTSSAAAPGATNEAVTPGRAVVSPRVNTLNRSDNTLPILHVWRGDGWGEGGRRCTLVRLIVNVLDDDPGFV